MAICVDRVSRTYGGGAVSVQCASMGKMLATDQEQIATVPGVTTVRAVRAARRRRSRTVTFSGYTDQWVTARMRDRQLRRNAVIEYLILSEMERGGRQLTAAEVNDLAGHANTIALVLAPLKLKARNPDDVRAYAEAYTALALIKRLLHGV